MDVSAILTQGRVGLVDSTQYTDDEAIVHLNIVYQDTCSDIITKVDEDYFWNKITDSLVALQSEYRVEEIISSPTNLKINEINKVFVKYDVNNEYFSKCRRVNPSALDRDWEWYEKNQSSVDPIFYVQDNSVFIAPYPSANVTGGIKMEVIYQPTDLTKTGTEASIAIPRRFHRVLIAGLRVFASQSRGVQFMNATQAFQAAFDREKLDMVSQLRARNQEIIQVQEPNLTNLC